jgi:cell division septation protein DedD
MAEARKPRARSPIVTAVGLMLLAIPGFALGLLAGVAWEEPGLLTSHVLGRTTEAYWGEESAGEQALPDVAAPVAEVTRMRPEVLSPGGREAVPGVPEVPGTATRSVAPVASVPERGRFVVQVGAFGESATAERLAKRLRHKGWQVTVSPGARAGESRWRVRVGPHPTREQAAEAAAKLKAREKLPTWVLDENGSA